MELNQLRILVVDDNIPAAEMLQQLLAETGVGRVFITNDGREAQEFLDADPDLVNMIICDWRMPRMTGLELLQQVRMAYPEMPFMMVTGNADSNSIEAARDFGVSAYIAKPYSLPDLRTKLDALAMQL